MNRDYVRLAWPFSTRKSPVYRTLLDADSILINITDPGQWSASTSVTVIRTVGDKSIRAGDWQLSEQIEGFK